MPKYKYFMFCYNLKIYNFSRYLLNTQILFNFYFPHSTPHILIVNCFVFCPRTHYYNAIIDEDEEDE